MEGRRPDISVAIPAYQKHHREMIDFNHIQIVAVPWHVSPNGQVIQGWNLFWSNPYLNFVPHIPLCWLNNFVLFRFWKLPTHVSHFDSSSGPDSNGYKSIRLLSNSKYLLPKQKSNGNHLEWPNTKTIRPMTKRGSSGNQFTIWTHFVNKPWFEKNYLGTLERIFVQI